jgi:hypothetical protein
MNKILIILSLVLLASCSTKEVPTDELIERQGIIYEINSQTPFSGRSVSYLENGQRIGEETYKDGKVDGSVRIYYENGELRSKVCYKNGEKTNMSYCEK